MTVVHLLSDEKIPNESFNEYFFVEKYKGRYAYDLPFENLDVILDELDRRGIEYDFDCTIEGTGTVFKRKNK